MTGEPACLGSAELFLDPCRLTEAAEVCRGCDCRFGCALEAVRDVWIGDDGQPEVWLVRGGLYPHEQVDLWRASSGGRFAGVVAEAVRG